MPLAEDQIVEIRAQFAERVLELITDPRLKNAGFPEDLYERVLRGEKIEGSRMIRDALAALGQDLRLPIEDRLFLKELFLKGSSNTQKEGGSA